MSMLYVSANVRLLRKLLIVAVVMFGFGFTLVPFYQKICDVTGLNAQSEELTRLVNAEVDTSRLITVEFVANTADGLAWQFEPLQKSIRVHPGQLTQVYYRAVNRVAQPVTGHAVPSYGPALAGQYFKKLECFCFRQQTLSAHEERRMPVQFLVDSRLPTDVRTITLSYTFYAGDAAGKS
ncbi:MAG: cytochrome c oxidase assembly protein [Burkholderiales bacterium]